MDKDILINKSDKWFGFGRETVAHKDFNMHTKQEYDVSYVILFKRKLGILKFKHRRGEDDGWNVESN